MLFRLSRAVLIICAAGIGGAVLLGIAAAFWLPSDAVGLAQMARVIRPPNDKAPNELPQPEPPLRKPTQIIGDKRFLANDAITAVAVSPDGKILAAGMQSFPNPDPVILWNAVTGEEIGRLTEHEGMTNRMTFSPDGVLLYTGGHSCHSLGRADELLRIWDVASRKLIQSWPADDWALAPDGRTLASVDSHHAINDGGGDPVPSDFNARVWDTRTWKELWSHHEVGEMGSIAITPDGRYVACGGVYDTTIHIWDRIANKELKKLKAKDSDGSIYLLSFSPDGHILAAASVLAMVPRPFVLWDWTAGKELYLFRDRSPFHLAFTPDGKFLLTSEGRAYALNLAGIAVRLQNFC
jgi:WD40 repeat protein